MIKNVVFQGCNKVVQLCMYIYIYTCILCAKLLQSCLILCDPMDYSSLGSSVHGILQTRILEWAAISFSRGFPDPGIKPVSLKSPALAGRLFTISTIWEACIYYVHICIYSFSNSYPIRLLRILSRVPCALQ